MIPIRTLFLLGAALGCAPRLTAADDKEKDPETALVEAVTADKAFIRNELRHVRGAFAKYFERTQADAVRAGFGGDYDAVTKWLGENPEVRETLFTAIDPAHDDVAAACRVFRDLFKLGPDAVKAYPNVAVACAVVWDDPRAVYDYRPHQVRTRSRLPDGVMAVGVKENYQYLTAADHPFKAQVQQLPWEFLVHVVNHRTPDGERDWATQQYQKRRAGIGAVYKEVEYDKLMLQTRSEVCRLNDKPYTLESIRKHGGVCAMQADFAARVGKSLGVPAEYVGGEGNSGGLHAWVMWVELRAVNKDKLDFVLMSEGRYLLDQYYVGTLLDPRTGRETTDRDMERRLATVGAAPQNGRQADLLMRAYPVVRDRKGYTTKQQVAYCQRVLDVFPHAERAWRELADLSAGGGQPDAGTGSRLAEKAFDTFAKFPDFSWQLFDPLLTPAKDKAARARLFERAVAAYERLGRPDLACEARLKLVGYQEDAKEHKKAAEGLAVTILKFPAEGRYVPRMMDKLADVCGRYKGGTDKLARFYLELLPRVPARRGDAVSEYAVKLHEQAVEFFKSNNKPKEAAQVEQRLAAVKRGRV